MWLGENMERIVELFSHALRYVLHRYLNRYAGFGSRVAIDDNVRVRNASSILLGDSIHLQTGVWLNALRSQTQPVIEIQNGCDIGRFCFISAASSVVLEEDVLLSPNVIISDHSHVTTQLDQSILRSGITKSNPVRLKKGCWVGANSVILPGVTIGKHAVVGANSVVRTSVPDFCVAVGSPAKIVKKLNV